MRLSTFGREGHHVDEPAIKDQRPAGDLAVDETGRLAEANNFEALAWRRRNGSEEVGHLTLGGLGWRARLGAVVDRIERP